VLPFKYFEQSEAQGMVEYAFILVLVAMVAIVGLALLGTTVYQFLDGFAEQLGEFIGD
jgi:Flp pilus assembly pilin Flp